MQTTNRRWLGVLFLLPLMTVPAGLVAQEAAAEKPPTTPTGGNLALLNAIPNDATGFVAIRNLKELDADIQAVSAQIGFPLGPEGMFPAPLDWMKTSLQMTQGLRDDGGAAMVLLNARDIKSVQELPDRLVLYIPATDPKALLTAMGGEEGKDGLYKVDLAGSPSVAAIREGFVLIAKAPEGGTDAAPQTLVAAAKAKGEGVAKAMAPDRLEAYAHQDLFVWVNFRTLSDNVRKEITDGLKELLANLQGMSGAATQPEGGNEAAEAVDKFLTQGEEVSLGISLNPKVGLGISAYSRVKPDTDLAKMIGASQPPKGSLLAGLPDEDFIFAGGAVVGTTPESLEQMRKTLENLAKRVASMDTDPGTPLTVENLKPLINLWVDLMKNTQQAGISISKIGNAEGEGGLVGMAVVGQVKDAKAWRGQVRQSFDKIKQIVAGVAKADGVEQAQIDQIMNAFVWQENAGEVAGAPVDVLRVELDKIESVPANALQQVKSVIGQEGVVFRIAAVGDNQVAIAFGGGEERLAKIIGLMKENQAPLAKNARITKVAGRMPKANRVGEGYFSLDNLLALVDAIATRVQSPLPVKLSLANAAPIAFTTINVDKLAQQIDFLIPAELIVSGSQMVRQQLLPMFMMGGMGGGQMGTEEPSESTKPDEGAGEQKEEKPAPAPRPRRARPARPQGNE